MSSDIPLVILVVNCVFCLSENAGRKRVSTTKGMKEFGGMTEIFYSLIVVGLQNCFVKTHQTVHVKERILPYINYTSMPDIRKKKNQSLLLQGLHRQKTEQNRHFHSENNNLCKDSLSNKPIQTNKATEKSRFKFY